MAPRRKLPKDLGALQLLPDLEIEDFKQEVRCSQETFAYILHCIEGK